MAVREPERGGGVTVGPEHHGEETPHLPGPSLWPIGFAVGVAVLLVGLVINPLLVGSIGGALVVLFGFLWVRDAMRGESTVPGLEPELAAGDGRPPAPAIPA